MKENFDTVFEKVVGHEGGYTRHRKDRGNWTSGRIGVGELKGTKYGISAMAYPRLDIRNLTLQDAKDIYRRDYWDSVRGDELPSGIDYIVFDIAVNHGVSDAVRWLQKAVGAAVDGIFGPKTLSAVWAAKPLKVITQLGIIRMHDYMSLSSFSTFGRGWTRRNFEVVVDAVLFALDQSKVDPEPVSEPQVKPEDTQDGFFGSLFRRV